MIAALSVSIFSIIIEAWHVMLPFLKLMKSFTILMTKYLSLVRLLQDWQWTMKLMPKEPEVRKYRKERKTDVPV